MKLYEWRVDVMMPRWYMGKVYHSPYRRQVLYVIFGFHYLALIAMWFINIYQRQRLNESFIDKEIRRAIKEDRQTRTYY